MADSCGLAAFGADKLNLICIQCAFRFYKAACFAHFAGFHMLGNHVNAFHNNLAFGGYNKAFAPNRTGYDWLSADSENVDRYIADPLCGADATVGLFRQMLHGIAFNQNPKNLARMDSSLPVLLISGDRDPVGDMGKGVRRTADAFRKAGLSDVTLKLYPGLRHEILNEVGKDEVYNDIAAWCAKKI